MITVYNTVKQYCQDNNLPPASRSDLSKIGKLASQHFKVFWGVNQPKEVIQQAGFLVSDEPGRAMLVIGYPDCFWSEIMAGIGVFYEQKAARQQQDIESQKIQPEKVTKEVTSIKRKRKAVPQKVWSAKPENKELLLSETNGKPLP